MPTTFDFFEEKDVHEEPFVFFLKKSFLKPDFFEKLDRQWPDDEFFSDIKYGMGGRRGFGNHTVAGYERFEKLIESSSEWKTFYDEVNSAEYCQHLLEVMRPHAEEMGTTLDFDKLSFVDLKPEDRAKAADNEYYIDFNITEAKKGYWREPHHDNPNKLAVFLLYFNDLREPGGELQIFGHKENLNYPDYERFPLMEDVNLVEEIRPEANLIAGTMNSRNAYHGVGEITSDTAHRRFVYIAIGLRNDVRAWKLGKPKKTPAPTHI
jgi:hypothetical protein